MDMDIFAHLNLSNTNAGASNQIDWWSTTKNNGEIISINPSKESNTSNIPLSVKVYAKSVEDLTKMIAEMDKEGVFLVDPTNQEPPVQTGDIGFSLSVSYEPRPAISKGAKKKTTVAVKQVVNQGEDDE